MTARCTGLQGTTQCILQAGHTGDHRTDWPPASEPAPAVAPTRRGVSQRALGFGLIALILAIGAYGAVTRGASIADTGGDSNVVPPPWQPTGFTLADDRDVAYRWLTPSEFDCDIADRCWGMFVVPKSGCGSLYVELAILDEAGTNVGYTNDVASGVGAGQQAKLVFDNFEDGASKARISKVSCH